MGRCCVAGCVCVSEDLAYFEFPASRVLRNKWLKMIQIPSKIPLGTVVCSQHFNRNDYEVVRGKARLRKKVVPTLKLYNNNTENTIEDTPTRTDELPSEKNVETTTYTAPDSTTGNTVELPVNSDITEEVVPTGKNKKDKDGICKRNSKDKNTNSEVQNERTSPPDPKQPPDFEDMITNYQIKNKPNALLPQVEIEVPAQPEPILLDDKDDAPPVFIEISVDKDTSAANTSAECMMVLESVQVEIDPASLMLPEREYDEEIHDIDHTDPGQDNDEHKKAGAISLLTSSDDDDVILEEPHIDTVEVSDETDEDDKPLVTLIKKPKTKKKKTKKKTKKVPKPTNRVNALVWHGSFDLFCMQCHFSTTNPLDYKLHLQEHQTILQVCHICNYTSASKTQFSRHVRKHKEEKKYKCHLCDYRAKHNMSLIYHLQCHEKGRSKSVVSKECVKCDNRSCDKMAALRHLSASGAGKRYSCDLCEYRTDRRSDLKRHRTRRHQDAVEVESDCDGNPLWP